jgi:hypothetical protein
LKISDISPQFLADAVVKLDEVFAEALYQNVNRPEESSPGLLITN